VPSAGVCPATAAGTPELKVSSRHCPFLSHDFEVSQGYQSFVTKC